MTMKITRIMACVGALATFALQPQFVGSPIAVGASPAPAQAKASGATPTSTFSTLPSMGGPTEALAVNEAGTIIVGSSWDRRDVWHAVKWTLKNGAWALTDLPRAPSAVSAIARGVNNAGDVAGNDFPGPIANAVLWPAAGGFTMLDCTNDARPETVNAISTRAQVVVGVVGSPGDVRTAAVWRLGAPCREMLPGLVQGKSSEAAAVNGDGTVIGGSAIAAAANDSSVPVRWQKVIGGWLIEQLDVRRGRAAGANATGDLAGSVDVPCASVGGCQRAVIWYAVGGSRELPTLGGKDSWARDVNSTREVVGGSTSPTAGNTGFFWSESTGMIQLPFKGRWAMANALSDVRPDGSRLVVGMDSQGQAVAWAVRNP
jgi:uncharacterized membrane protein